VHTVYTFCAVNHFKKITEKTAVLIPCTHNRDTQLLSIYSCWV